MACPFKTLTTAIMPDNSRVIAWALSSDFAYPEDFLLLVENSREGSKWEAISEDVKNECHFTDYQRRNWNKNMDEYYRLHLHSADEDYYSEPIKAGYANIYPFSAEAKNAISNIEKAIQLSGVTGVLLKRKVWGPRCPLCTDFAGQATVNEHCPRCLGTGIDGGFYPGITLNLVKDQIQQGAGLNIMGAQQQETVTGRCVAYPWITTGDIWCEGTTNKRFRINTCSPAASYKTVPLVYQISMSRIEYTDAMYTREANDLVENNDKWQNDGNYTEPAGTENKTWEGALD